MQLTDYIRHPVSQMLGSLPFRDWPVERSVDDDLDERIVNYVFPQNGLALLCDSNEDVRTMFLYSEDRGGFDESLFEIPFSLTREGVFMKYGQPAKRGPRSTGILGESGAWERFVRPQGVVVHIQYRTDADSIELITLMCAEDAP